MDKVISGRESGCRTLRRKGAGEVTEGPAGTGVHAQGTAESNRILPGLARETGGKARLAGASAMIGDRGLSGGKGDIQQSVGIHIMRRPSGRLVFLRRDNSPSVRY